MNATVEQSDPDAAVAASSAPWWPRTAYAYAVVVALGIAYFISKSPLQVNDCIDNLLEVQRNGFRGTVVSQFLSHAFLRPFLWAQLAISFDLANGRYHEMYKAIHAVQLVATALLFVNVLRVRSLAGLLAVPFGVAVLFGSHTFTGTIVEGFPINTFLTIVVCCLMAANLSFGEPAWWRDAAAAVLFVFAAFTVESGLLVWVIVCVAWMTGARGVSTRGVAVMTALLLGYFTLRFGPLHVGMPALVERSSGFGFRVLDPPELIALFGAHPWVFYAYNVMCQLLTVLFAEPKGGVFVFVRRLTGGDLLPRDLIAVASTTGATLLIAWYARTRMGEWRRGIIAHGDRVVFVFLAVFVANAVLSYAYTKDVIASPAGVFHALAATVAFAHALARVEQMPSFRPLAAGLTLALTLLSTGWAVKLVGVHYHLHDTAFLNRNDWMEMGPTTTRWQVPEDPKGAAMIRQLYEQAVRMRVPGTYFYPAQGWRYFESW
jgi:hypothetical protein